MIKSNKGETPVWLLIAIVLGVIVLVLVGLGFAGGWEGILDRLNIFGGSTLTSVGQGCSVSCSAGDNVGWCKDIKTLKGLEEGQLNLVCKNIGVADVAKCKSEDKLEVKASDNIQLVDFKTKRAKATCESLLKAQLISPCSEPILCTAVKSCQREVDCASKAADAANCKPTDICEISKGLDDIAGNEDDKCVEIAAVKAKLCSTYPTETTCAGDDAKKYKCVWK